ncbi:DUF4352 domain-containing protein [Nocardiopsis nanhaiensis]
MNHRPPEEWRPGDPGDPIEDGAMPPGEPAHEFPTQEPPPEPPSNGAYQYGGPAPEPQRSGQPEESRYTGNPDQPVYSGQPDHPLGGSPTGQPAGQPPGQPPGEPPPEPPGGHPTGAPPEPLDPGEISYGPSGPEQAGYEHAGYAPGYGEYPGEPGVPQTPGGYGGPGGYQPPPPKKTPWGKIFGIGCGAVLILLLLVGGCGALLHLVADAAPRPQSGPENSAPEQPAEEEAGESEAEVTATGTEFEPSSLHTDGDYTSVEVSVTNAGEAALDVNPLYFTVVDAEGAEHEPGEAISMDDNEIGVQILESGQSASGAITVEGEIEPDHVVFEPFFTGPVEAPVS